MTCENTESSIRLQISNLFGKHFAKSYVDIDCDTSTFNYKKTIRLNSRDLSLLDVFIIYFLLFKTYF